MPEIRIGQAIRYPMFARFYKAKRYLVTASSILVASMFLLIKYRKFVPEGLAIFLWIFGGAALLVTICIGIAITANS